MQDKQSGSNWKSQNVSTQFITVDIEIKDWKYHDVKETVKI